MYQPCPAVAMRRDRSSGSPGSTPSGLSIRFEVNRPEFSGVPFATKRCCRSGEPLTGRGWGAEADHSLRASPRAMVERAKRRRLERRRVGRPFQPARPPGEGRCAHDVSFVMPSIHRIEEPVEVDRAVVRREVRLPAVREPDSAPILKNAPLGREFQSRPPNPEAGVLPSHACGVSEFRGCAS